MNTGILTVQANLSDPMKNEITTKSYSMRQRDKIIPI